MSAGINVSGTDSVARLTDTTVLDTRVAGNGAGGIGVVVSADGYIDAVALTVDGAKFAGVLADGARTGVFLRDVDVVRVGRGAIQTVAAGLVAQNGAVTTADRARVETPTGIQDLARVVLCPDDHLLVVPLEFNTQLLDATVEE